MKGAEGTRNEVIFHASQGVTGLDTSHKVTVVMRGLINAESSSCTSRQVTDV